MNVSAPAAVTAAHLTRMEEMQSEFHSFQFKLDESGEESTQHEDFLVDSGCTRHISFDETLFTEFDDNFKQVLENCDLTINLVGILYETRK